MGDVRGLDRREVLAGLLAVGALACATGTVTKDDDTDTDGTNDTDTDTSDTTGSDTDVVDTDGGVTTTWLTGGTAAMGTAYAVTFDDTSCAQTCELTLGPCYADTMERQDISEAVDGLGTRLALRVVDPDCNPIADAVVDVWHCAPSGLYSGSDAASMCTSNDSAARASRWFRGTQTTDADGVATFDTCLPGWYSGRAVHIHFQVRRGTQAWVTSQLGFPEDLLSDVFTTHPAYSDRGTADTPNARDNILSSDLTSYLFRWRQASDGALVVWKTITLRGALSDGTC
ncbi:MAG: protocatechuate 3,4-dioxygenase [Alphaproteobacteria bacterium]|nr:protocatechuate 3,4-dioxygenase [Alphaproteobacteria bacterium]